MLDTLFTFFMTQFVGHLAGDNFYWRIKNVYNNNARASGAGWQRFSFEFIYNEVVLFSNNISVLSILYLISFEHLKNLIPDNFILEKALSKITNYTKNIVRQKQSHAIQLSTPLHIKGLNRIFITHTNHDTEANK